MQIKIFYILLGVLVFIFSFGIAGCMKSKPADPVNINPIIIPPGVPPITIDNYYDTEIPVSVSNRPAQSVSLLPPGSLLSQQSEKKS